MPKSPFKICARTAFTFTDYGSNNCIPAEIWNMTWCHIDDFKFKLDNFSNTITDEPKVLNLTPAASNMITANPS